MIFDRAIGAFPSFSNSSSSALFTSRASTILNQWIPYPPTTVSLTSSQESSSSFPHCCFPPSICQEIKDQSDQATVSTWCAWCGRRLSSVFSLIVCARKKDRYGMLPTTVALLPTITHTFFPPFSSSLPTRSFDRLTLVTSFDLFLFPIDPLVFDFGVFASLLRLALTKIKDHR